MLLIKYVMIGNALPNQLQRYNKICGYANFSVESLEFKV